MKKKKHKDDRSLFKVEKKKERKEDRPERKEESRKPEFKKKIARVTFISCIKRQKS